MTIIATDRLLLRPVRRTDTPVLLTELNNYDIVKQTARIPYPYAQHDADEWLDWIEVQDDQSLICAVELKGEPGLIGIVSALWSAEKSDAELGYWYSPRAWGRGIATESARAAINHAFGVLGHPAMIACFHNDNPASARVLQKLGFRIIGQCRNYSKAQAREVDVTNTRLERADWQPA